MIGILIIGHTPLGETLLKCAKHVFGQIPERVEAIDVTPDVDPNRLATTANQIARSLDIGQGVLVLTDMMGGTPANIARQLECSERVTVVTGVNLPMLLRAITYRHEALHVAAQKALEGGIQGIVHLENNH